ncbi:UNVERIFIED_CONTAM: hypothetical protein Sangu_3207700, partial [Sesamum angustifolium]
SSSPQTPTRGLVFISPRDRLTDDRFGHLQATDSPHSLRVTTPSEVTAPELADPALAIPMPNIAEGPSIKAPAHAGDVPLQWLARLEVMGATTEEQTGIPFTKRVMVTNYP